MDKYSKGGVMTKSSGDSQEIARKGECKPLFFSLPPLRSLHTGHLLQDSLALYSPCIQSRP